MKVYVVQDLATNTIINIHATKKSAEVDFNIDPAARLMREYEVINADTKFKSITETADRVYDPKHMDSIMPFGKFQGKRIDELIEEEPQYIQWCVKNLNFNLDEECQEFLQEMLVVKE